MSWITDSSDTNVPYWMYCSTIRVEPLAYTLPEVLHKRITHSPLRIENRNRLNHKKLLHKTKKVIFTHWACCYVRWKA